MSDLTRAEIEAFLENLTYRNQPGVKTITQLLLQLDAANAKAAEEQALFGRMAEMCDHIQAKLDAANARLGAALREAATEGAGLVDGNVEAASVYGAILALAPDATAALDRALEQMRERCAQEAQYIATVGDGQSIAAAIRALPLHEEPNT